MKSRIEISDQQLVKNFVAGEAKAMDELIARHSKKLYNYIKNLVKDPVLAEDVLQDTFIKAIHSLKRGSYHDDGKFIAWIMRIAHNLVIDHFRKEKKYREVSNESGEVDLFNNANLSEDTIEMELTKMQLSKDLQKIVQALPREQREIVIMRHYFDMSFKEIAEQTDVSINTALGRMRYALINMRKIIESNKISLTA
ncbi:MAG: sigma-70 family RNA polymerase sigma factor [Bacteroidales bacterium]|jgi:RNA polymerase sigma-70 factor (ECF subfamily)|nr:sigma-70 family RNA polymerase sigma factor [Bacteroidales bacterium]